MGSFYDLSAVDIDGQTVSFEQYRGQVLLVVNVASKWGHTKTAYTHMADMQKRLKSRGFEVLGFPCNQFGGQEPWPEAEIKKWVHDKFDIAFPLFTKIDVNGEHTHPTYAFLKRAFPGDITWNFHGRFLIDHHGVPIRRWAKEPWEEVEKAIVAALDAKDKEAQEQKTEN